MKTSLKKMAKHFLIALIFPTIVQAADCVQIFYDRGPSDYWIGHANAVFLQNLMGHFPHLQQVVAPIESYQRGDLNRCKASIYVGTHFDAKIPDVFHTDYMSTTKNVAWLGYGIWRNPDLMPKTINYN